MTGVPNLLGHTVRNDFDLECPAGTLLLPVQFPLLTQPSQASCSVDEMVALEAHTLHQRDVQIAQRRPVLLVYQVLAELAAASQKNRELEGAS